MNYYLDWLCNFRVHYAYCLIGRDDICTFFGVVLNSDAVEIIEVLDCIKGFDCHYFMF